MSHNLIALQNKFLGLGETLYDKLSQHYEAEGILSDQRLAELAETFHLPPQHVRSVARFYEELSHNQPAKQTIKLCNGEACRAAGCQKSFENLSTRLGVQKAGDTSEQGIRLEHVACLGYCGLGPNVMVDQQVFSLAQEENQHCLERFLKDDATPLPEEPINPIFFPPEEKPRIVMRHFDKDVISLKAAQKAGIYKALEKSLRSMEPNQVIQEIKQSQIRGRGGAGFPSGIKLETVANAESQGVIQHDLAVGADVKKQSEPQNPIAASKKFVVVNADEGDAGSYIDKEIMERDPHSLIEGALLAAYATGAEGIFFYVRFEYPRALKRLQQAVEEAQSAGLIGKSILGSNFSCQIKIVKGQGAYICGEETSLLRSLEGLPAQVSPKPPFPAIEGLWGRPTAVNNVETLHNFPWIVEHGGNAYAQYGHDKSRGTKAVSLNTRVKNPGFYEVELGTTLRELIFEIAGGMQPGQEFKAVQVGGPLGGIFPESLLDTPLDFEAMNQAKGLLGHAGIVVYSMEDDLVQIGRGLMEFCAIESCGKCFPCRIGAVRGTELFDQIIEKGPSQKRLDLMAELCETMKYGSLCALGGAIPTPIENLMEFFPEEFSRYNS